MKNLVERLCVSGLSEEQAGNSVLIVLDWVKENYPVLAVLAENKMRSEAEAVSNSKTAEPL